MPLDVGRVTHLLEQMHRSEDDAGDPIDQGKVLVTDGARGFTWEDFGGSEAGVTDAGSIEAISSESGSGGENVQDQLDELYGALGWSVDSVGSITETSSPVTIQDDSTWNEFPGAVRLDASRVLLVYRGNGTSHAANGQICGQILTLTDDHSAIEDVGTKYTILDDAGDLRCEDPVSIIDGQLVIAFRYFDGADNHDPSFIICDDPPQDYTSASTWGSPIPLPDPGGTVQEYTQGRVRKLSNDTYILGGGFDSGGDHTVGVWRWTGTLDDPSAATFVTVGSGGNDYSEITFEETDDAGGVRALLRSDTNDDIDTKTSTDYGATWSSVSNAYDGHGNPMFRKLLSTLYLTVYRDAPNGDTAWRSSTDGATWGSETILDTTGTRSAYATLVPLTPHLILCVYGIEYSTGGATGTADLFAQIFTDSSTFAANITIELSDDTPLIESGAGDPGVSTEASRSDHVHPEFSSGSEGVGEILISDTPSTPLIFADLVQNEAQNDLVYADP